MARLTMRCMNCDAEIVDGKAELFAEVLVCPKCHAIATRLYTKGKEDLQRILTLLKDAIRVGLVQKKLQFATPDTLQGVEKVELLARLAEIAQKPPEL